MFVYSGFKSNVIFDIYIHKSKESLTAMSIKLFMEYWAKDFH